MAETKYGKYIITELKKKFDSPYETKFRPEDQTEILFLDGDIVKGAFVVEAVWFLPERVNRTEDDVVPHTHDYKEVLAMFGTNMNDPHDLCGECEAWLDDEKHIINKSCLVYIPKGLRHGPFKFTKIEKPVFHFVIALTNRYS